MMLMRVMKTISKFSGLYDKYFPKQHKKVIARNPNKPWITQGILFSIKRNIVIIRKVSERKPLLLYLNTKLIKISLPKSLELLKNHIL